uniref:Uncharacterized protein n=1 Tax=Avena sativa TaxID=4498 RepID=A0ACD5XVR2_AVESA
MAAPATNSAVVGTLSRSKRARAARANRRDWANLTAGPAGLIAEKLLEDDVADYLRFRAVCSPWRRCTESLHSGKMDSGRFHPRRWIMVPEVFAGRAGRRDFLNVSTGERVRVDIPELRDRVVVGLTSDGLLVLQCGKGTGELCLLNPLTRQLTALPNVASLLNSRSTTSSSTNLLSELKKLRPCFGTGLADGSTVALYFEHGEAELAVARPGDERWRCRVRPQPKPDSDSDSDEDSDLEPSEAVVSAISFGSRFYCITGKGVKVVDAASAAIGQPPQVVWAVEEDEYFHWLDIQAKLVDNDGELVMVRPTPGSKMQRYEAHRVDLDAGKMVRVRNLRGRAVFVCERSGRAVSVRPAELCSTIRADTVYKCWCDRDESQPPRIRACHVEKGWMTWDSCVQRGSVVDYLSRYVCRSEDTTVVPAPAPPPRRRKRKANSKVFGDDWVN